MLSIGLFIEVSFKSAAVWTGIWICLAMVFNSVLYLYSAHKFGSEIGQQVSLEFLTGFVMEKALAVDNLFVFVLVLSYFKIPKILQHRVLFYGIFGALIFRAIFIALGSILMEYQGVVIFFGLFLIYTGYKMIKTNEHEEDLDQNKLLKLLKRIFPVTNNFEGNKFFILESGIKKATPLFMALVFLELSDIVFAIDSVPAIFAITKEPFIVFTSNIFAILGLRSMFFMLGGVMNQFVYLKQGLALILMFVGLKMTVLNKLYNGHFSISWSLGIIGLILFSSIGLSWLKKQN